ncbi:ras-like protein family member 11B isoform X2 [Acanthaster planci]|uniref:small monomeric GTPase n=1 Tax=Acanthaster planci TaxID=133434 RepID=A0A8B8A2L8_ACAPL|nr:ras-like protein family member 11B isoform X2 [Acanthaster planci]
MNQRISAVNNVLGFDIVALASNLCSTSYVYFIRLNGVGHGGSRQLFLSTFPHAARLHQQDKLSDYHCYVNTFVENKHVATFYVLGWTLVANFGSRPSVHVGTHFWTNSAKVSRTMSTSSPFGRRKKSGSQTEVKIAVTGVSGVGKSAVTVRFLTKRFIGEYGHEPETKYHHQCKIDGDIVLMEILDTGHENVLTEDVLQWADGLLLVYSITDLRSIEAIRRARNTLEESRNSKAVPVAFTVVANKADLLHLRKVKDYPKTWVARSSSFLLRKVTIR